MNKSAWLIAALISLPLASVAQVSWDELSAEQQQTLSRFENDWPQLDAGRQERLAKGAERWQNMTP